MSQQETPYQLNQNPLVHRDGEITSKNFLPNVFLWMFIALGLSASFAYYFSVDATLMQYLYMDSSISELNWLLDPFWILSSGLHAYLTLLGVGLYNLKKKKPMGSFS